MIKIMLTAKSTYKAYNVGMWPTLLGFFVVVVSSL